jgi:DNA-binding transcriptional regulator YiaG
MEKSFCPTCGKKYHIEIGDYCFRESGLDNVWLEDVEILNCDCGQSASVPRVPDILAIIADIIIKQNSMLSGKEIRFLRKNMWVKAGDFAAMLEVDPLTLAKWEAGEESPAPYLDKRIRFVYAMWIGKKELAIQIARDIYQETTQNKLIHIPVSALKSMSRPLNC